MPTEPKGKKISRWMRKRRRPLRHKSSIHAGFLVRRVDSVEARCRGLTPRLLGSLVWGAAQGGPDQHPCVCKAELFLPNGTRKAFWGGLGVGLQGGFCSYFSALAFLIVTYINMKRAPTFSVVLTGGTLGAFHWREARRVWLLAAPPPSRRGSVFAQGLGLFFLFYFFF